MAKREGAQNVRKPPLPNIVPSVLVSSIQDTEPQDMALRDCNNNLWHLKIEKFGDDWYFTDGWVKFVEDNMIKGGDVLFYQYSSQGLLDFKILGPSDREDDRTERLENTMIVWQDDKIEVKVEHEESADDIDKNPPKEWNDHPQKEKMVDDEDVDDIDNNPPKKRYGRHPRKEKVVDAGASSRVRGKRRKKQDYYGTEIFTSGEVPQPMNPYFVAQARETRVNEMYIPTDLVKCYKLQFPSVLMLVDPQGREFHTMRTSWKGDLPWRMESPLQGEFGGKRRQAHLRIHSCRREGSAPQGKFLSCKIGSKG